MSCYSFVWDNNSTLILTCRSKLVSYYLSEVFFMLDRYSKSLNSMPLRVKKLIHVVNFFDSDDIMSYSTTILYVENTVKNFFCGIISDEIILHPTMIIMIPLKFCFSTIQLVVLKTSITHPLLKNSNLTCTGHILQISSIGVFI